MMVQVASVVFKVDGAMRLWLVPAFFKMDGVMTVFEVGSIQSSRAFSLFVRN